MPASSLYAVSGTPYNRNALGVDPPLWSRAAKNPCFSQTCAIILSVAMNNSPFSIAI
jgi:hypothetical protein